MKLLPIAEVQAGYSWIPDNVPHVGVTEDTALGEVRGPGPDGDWLPVAQEDDELVVCKSARIRRSHLAQIPDLGVRDRLSVGLGHLLLPRVIHDANVCAVHVRQPQGIEDREVRKLVGRHAQAPPRVLRLFDEVEHVKAVRICTGAVGEKLEQHTHEQAGQRSVDAELRPAV